jgi:hypothetical protein
MGKPKQQKAFIIYEDELEKLIDIRFKGRILFYNRIRKREVPDPELCYHVVPVEGVP